MAFAITQSCCSDASCVAVCPVDCIHPTPDEPDFGLTDMLYIDPRSCIDCGACADACPVDAITPVDLLRGPDTGYADLNRAHFEGREAGDLDTSAARPPVFPSALPARAPGSPRLRVAIVGTGPAASYTASELLTAGAEVTMYDRLTVPGGLVRFGVAPDHTSTRAIAGRFATVRRHPRLRLRLGVEVGRDISHDELLAGHDAVVYGVGAASDRRLGVPGEELVGSVPARTVVGWYNDHPEVAPGDVDLTGVTGRAVLVGTGNVALDVARILLTDPDLLAGTEIAPHALAALRRDPVSDVVLLARRGPEALACSLSELRPVLDLPGVEVVVDGGPEVSAVIDDPAAGPLAAALRGRPVARVDWSSPVPADRPGRRRLVLRFDSPVEAVQGAGRVEAVLAGGARIPADLLVRSIGYRSEPVPGLPFDPVTHTVPHEAGRVVDPTTGVPVPATYVVGWVKRGPTGGIGHNRTDAAETVATLVGDVTARAAAGRRPTPV